MRTILYRTQDDPSGKMNLLLRPVFQGSVMPVFFVGATLEEVTSKFHDFWIRERLKLRPDSDPWAELGIARPGAASASTSLEDLLV